MYNDVTNGGIIGVLDAGSCRRTSHHYALLFFIILLPWFPMADGFGAGPVDTTLSIFSTPLLMKRLKATLRVGSELKLKNAVLFKDSLLVNSTSDPNIEIRELVSLRYSNHNHAIGGSVCCAVFGALPGILLLVPQYSGLRSKEWNSLFASYVVVNTIVFTGVGYLIGKNTWTDWRELDVGALREGKIRRILPEVQSNAGSMQLQRTCRW